MDEDHITIVQITFAVDESRRPDVGQLLAMIDALDGHGLAAALGVPHAEDARRMLRDSANHYDRVIEASAGEMRDHSLIAGTSLLVCVASDIFSSEDEDHDGWLNQQVSAHWMGALAAFLRLLEQVPALGGPAGLASFGMPALDTIRAHAVPGG